jgi:protein-tyrosine phosphatase
MGDRGLDLGGHVSRVMTAEMLDGADLVVGMERRHVREAAVLAPGAWPRAFTLRELARNTEIAGPRPAEVPVADWLAGIVAERTIAAHLGVSPEDDVADPIGRPLRAYRKCADALDGLVATVVDRLWPAPQIPSPDSLRSTTA